jgi:hypothetical protein
VLRNDIRMVSSARTNGVITRDRSIEMLPHLARNENFFPFGPFCFSYFSKNDHFLQFFNKKCHFFIKNRPKMAIFANFDKNCEFLATNAIFCPENCFFPLEKLFCTGQKIPGNTLLRRTQSYENRILI